MGRGYRSLSEKTAETTKWVQIELRMPFTFYLNSVMDQPNIASIFYGPVLLAAEEPAPRTDWRSVNLNSHNLEQTITGDSGTLQFQIGDVKLRPFFETYSRHSVYLNVILDKKFR